MTSVKYIFYKNVLRQTIQCTTYIIYYIIQNIESCTTTSSLSHCSVYNVFMVDGLGTHCTWLSSEKDLRSELIEMMMVNRCLLNIKQNHDLSLTTSLQIAGLINIQNMFHENFCYKKHSLIVETSLLDRVAYFHLLLGKSCENLFAFPWARTSSLYTSVYVSANAKPNKTYNVSMHTMCVAPECKPTHAF